MSPTSTTQGHLSVQYQGLQLAFHPSELFLDGQVWWLQGTDGLCCPRSWRCLQAGVSHAVSDWICLSVTFQENPYLDLPAWPHPWTGMGGTVLAQASWRTLGQVFLPRMPWSSLTLTSKSLNTQSVLLNRSILMPKIQCRTPVLTNEFPNSNLLLQNIKIYYMGKITHISLKLYVQNLVTYYCKTNFCAILLVPQSSLLYSH